MSRQVAAWSALLAAIATPAAAQDAGPMAAYRERTQAGIVCRETPAEDEIIVCGLRAADKYRTPIIAADPRDEGVPAERQRLISKNTPCQDRGPFLIGCGVAGATVSIGIGPGGGKPTLRKPAP